MPLLSTDELRDLLIELADSLAAEPVEARIYVVGGAAMALAYFEDAERATTRDVDAVAHPTESVGPHIERLARKHGLPLTWLNEKAAAFLPAHGSPEGDLIIERPGVRIEVAPAGLMLAMKLRATRFGRDTDDIAILLRRCDIRTAEEAGQHLEWYYPDDELSPKAAAFVGQALGPFTVSSSMPPMDLPAVGDVADEDRCLRWLEPGVRCQSPRHDGGPHSADT
jgi:hypothetical protein